MGEKSTTCKENPERRRNLALPPIDAGPEEIAAALFRPKPQGKTEKPTAPRRA